jgi:uncharacterized protein YeaO (DUF488 family)
MLQIKRAYEPAARGDGYRVLIDRLWPRGIKKTAFEIDEWAKELAPSTALRRDFGHDPEHWKEFQKRYAQELHAPEAKEKLRELASKAAKGNVTLVYAAKDEQHNNAVVLKRLLQRRRSSAGKSTQAKSTRARAAAKA